MKIEKLNIISGRINSHDSEIVKNKFFGSQFFLVSDNLTPPPPAEGCRALRDAYFLYVKLDSTQWKTDSDRFATPTSTTTFSERRSKSISKPGISLTYSSAYLYF